MRKAFGYIRTSTADQLNKSGPERQEEKIRSYATTNSIEVVRLFVEDISGTTDTFERPVFVDMINDILSNGVDLILIEDLSRLARDHHIQSHFISYLGSKNIDLVSADNGTNVIQAAREDDMMNALIQIQGVFNELEKKRIVRRLQKGREITGHRGGRPNHYPRELKNTINRLRGKRYTYSTIADKFNVEEVKTSTGRPWTPQLIRIVGGEMKVEEPARRRRRTPKK